MGGRFEKLYWWFWIIAGILTTPFLIGILLILVGVVGLKKMNR